MVGWSATKRDTGPDATYITIIAITTAATSAYITDVAPRERFGAAHGVFGTIYDVGDASGPIIGGLLVSAWGYSATLQFMAVVASMVPAMYGCTASVLILSITGPITNKVRNNDKPIST